MAFDKHGPMVLLTEKCRCRTVLPHCTVFPRQRGRGAGGGTSQLYTLKLYTHARTYFVQIPFETRRQRREREWKRCDERVAKEKTGLREEKYRGGDAEQRKREREIERESILRSRRAPVFPHRRTDGRAIPLGDHLTAHQQLPPDGYRVRRLLGIPFASHRSTPDHRTWNSLTDHDSSSGAGHTAERERYSGAKRGEQRRSFVVKRYRSARGFKRLLYEYTRGGGINGVAPLSCRRRRCVFARRNRKIISVIAVVARGVGASG